MTFDPLWIPWFLTYILVGFFLQFLFRFGAFVKRIELFRWRRWNTRRDVLWLNIVVIVVSASPFLLPSFPPLLRLVNLSQLSPARRPRCPLAPSSFCGVVWVCVGESLELVLVDGVEEVLVDGRQLGHLRRERLVEVRHVQRVALEWKGMGGGRRIRKRIMIIT